MPQQAVTHLVFCPSASGLVRQAVARMGRRDWVLTMMDQRYFGPLAAEDPDGRGNWLNASWCETGWPELLREDFRLPEISRQRGPRLVAWYAPEQAAQFANFLWWLAQVDGVAVHEMAVPELGFKNVAAIAELLGGEQLLREERRTSLTETWARLRSEDALLRIMEDDRLVSADVDVFDALILDFVPFAWERTIRVVGDTFSTICAETGHYFDDRFVCYRLRAMAQSGSVEWSGGEDMRDSWIRRPPRR